MNPPVVRSHQLVSIESMGSDITVRINRDHVGNWFVKIVRLFSLSILEVPLFRSFKYIKYNK